MSELDLEARWTAAVSLAAENDRLRLQVDLKRKTIERLTRIVADGDERVRNAFRAGFNAHPSGLPEGPRWAFDDSMAWDMESDAWTAWRKLAPDELP